MQMLLSVPYNAVQTDDEGTSYYVQKVTGTNEDGTYKTKKIKVDKGIESDYYTEIINSGLEEGDQVIVPAAEKQNSLEDMINQSSSMGGVLMSHTIIELEDIFKRFYIGTPNELEVLHGISLKVMEGEFVAIVGASGSGKSTLMNIIGALDRPTEGKYILDGVDMIAAKDAGTFQDPQPQDRFCFSRHTI